MLEVVYLVLGVITLIVLNAAYIGWRGDQLRKVETERAKR